jgi:hypothetical protein
MHGLTAVDDDVRPIASGDVAWFGNTRRLVCVKLACSLMILLCAAPSLAQHDTASAAAGSPVPAAPSPGHAKAVKIADLIAGKLAGDVDPASLFTSTLADGGAVR